MTPSARKRQLTHEHIQLALAVLSKFIRTGSETYEEVERIRADFHDTGQLDVNRVLKALEQLPRFVVLAIGDLREALEAANRLAQNEKLPYEPPRLTEHGTARPVR